MGHQQAASLVASSRRILVLGSAGSGKTTFSIRLADLLKLKLIHLDAHFWQPGWIASSQNQWRDIVDGLIQEESWIMDGTYENSLDQRLPAADTVILIEASRWTCIWRAIKRKATLDDPHRPDAPVGQKLDFAFLRYIWQYPKITHPFVVERLRQHGHDQTAVRLKGDLEINGFLKHIERKMATTKR